jgi:hypothetical protein
MKIFRALKCMLWRFTLPHTWNVASSLKTSFSANPSSSSCCWKSMQNWKRRLWSCGFSACNSSKGSWPKFLARSTVSTYGPSQPVHFSVQAATMLEFLVPLMNCFVRRWFCVVLGLKPLLHRHNWLSFGKFQNTECFLIPCPHHVLSRLSPSSETCKYVMAPITQTNLKRFSMYWYPPFCHVCLGCCAAEFGSSIGAYELPCIFNIIWCSHTDEKIKQDLYSVGFPTHGLTYPGLQSRWSLPILCYMTITNTSKNQQR